MKKFYFFLVACFLMGFAADAQTYQLHGQITGNTNWESKELTQNGDWYELTANFVAGEFGIKKDQEWIGGGGMTITEANLEYDFNTSGANSKSELVGAFIFRFNPTTNKVIMVPTELEDNFTYAVHGTIHDGSNWKSVDMIDNGDGTFSLTNDFYAGAFGVKKLNNGTQIGWFGWSAIGSPADNCEETAEGHNINITVAGNYTVTFDANTNAVTVKSNSGSSDPDPDPTTPKVYLSGEFNSWNGADDNYKFTEVTADEYTFSIASFSGNFKVVSDGSWLGTTTPVVSGESYVLEDIGYSNMALAAADATNVTFTFTPSSKTLVVTYTSGSTDPDPVVPETLYVLGDFVGNHWDPSNGVALDKDGTIFTGTINIETALDNDYGFFSLCTSLSASSDDWSVGTRYGATEKDKLVESGVAETFIAGDKAWQVLPGLYNIEVDFEYNTMKLTSKSDAVEAIVEDANVAPVYYNLQGVRVAEPTNGLYIVVRGDKVAKQLVK